MRRTSNPAKSAYDRARYADVRAAKIESAQRWYNANKQAKRDYDAARRAIKNRRRRADYLIMPGKYKNPPGERVYIRLRQYGLTVVGFLALFQSQGCKCACCGAIKTKGNKGWCVDHSHVTGAVRGILCGLCNTGIGALGDDLEGVMHAVAYLIGK